MDGIQAVEKQACPGSYQELSPTEFNHQKDMVVVLVRAAHAEQEFQGYQAVIPLNDLSELSSCLEIFPPGQAVGIVCPDGDCSGRLAIRLSNLGHPVYHLGGGLLEWYHNFRGAGAGLLKA